LLLKDRPSCCLPRLGRHLMGFKQHTMPAFSLSQNCDAI
jgi:hypothetical protein